MSADVSEKPVVDTEKLVADYIKVRDAMHAAAKVAKEEEDKFKAVLAKMETKLLGVLNDQNAQSVKTANGTFYKQEDIKPSAADWDTIYRWVRDNPEDGFEMLEKRLKKTFIVQYMERNKDEDDNPLLPPGVNIHREYVVRVRRD